MLVASALCAAALMALAAQGGSAAEARHFSFAYDQPHTTGYGVAGDIFDKKLQELAMAPWQSTSSRARSSARSRRRCRRSAPATSISF
jgi:hypothetical protein